MQSRSMTLCLVALAVVGCSSGVEQPEPIEETEQAIHSSHAGSPPWKHVLTCYGGCEAPHYDPTACGHNTSCGPVADGKWWYATERAAFHCGAKLKLTRGDKCVVVDVQDNGPASWVESNAASKCGTGYIIDTSPLVADYFGGGCGWGECFTVDVTPVPDDTPTGPCSGGDCNEACGKYGCACVDGQCNGGYCPGTGCTAQETANCAAFGTNCVDHECSGAFGPGTGCTAKETNDCAAFGCACVDHACNGGYCPGTGCTAKETLDCQAFGCGCVDHQCSGGIGCGAQGNGCTAKEIVDCEAKGCGCADHACSGEACAPAPGSGCSAQQKQNCAAFGCGCVDGQCNGGACPGSGCDAKQTSDCSAEGQSCAMGNCVGGAGDGGAGGGDAGPSNASGASGSGASNAAGAGSHGSAGSTSGAFQPDPESRGEAIPADEGCSLAGPPHTEGPDGAAFFALLALVVRRRQLSVLSACVDAAIRKRRDG